MSATQNELTLALIPARGGSKSIKNKNIKDFCGKPLIHHSIETALAAAGVGRVVVSTDDPNIAAAAKEAGAEVPFLRPTELALDETPDLPVFVHCLKWLAENEGYQPEILVHLRPTSPLRRAEMVDRGIVALWENPMADSVRGVCSPTQNPFKMWRLEEGPFMKPLIPSDIPEPYNQPRQNLPPVYWQNGYVDITRRRTIQEGRSMTGKNILPLVLDQADIFDIDDEVTWKYAEHLYREGRERMLHPL